MRTVGSHLGRIPNCFEVPDNPPPPQGTALPGGPPDAPKCPSQNPPPPPQWASGQQLVGGLVGVQTRGVNTPPSVLIVIREAIVPSGPGNRSPKTV